MADRDTGTYGLLRYEPGNPEFPTLPDGIPSLHSLEINSGAALVIERSIEEWRDYKSSGPGETLKNDQRYAGWYTLTTWVTPGRLDLGVIAQPITRTITLHNTRREPITVTALTLTTGVTLDSPGLPVVIPQFESIVFTLAISPDGPGEFEETLVFTTSEGDVSFIITGTRVEIFEFVPELPLKETLVMKTQVKRSKDGTDQTISLVKAPKSIYDYRIAQDDDVARSLLRNRIMGGSSQLLVASLKWPEARYLNAAMTPSDTVVQVDTTNASYEVGDNVAICTIQGNFIVRGQIDALTASSITLNSAVGVDVPRNSVIVPFGYGYINQFPTFGQYAANGEDARWEITHFDEPWLGSALPGSFSLLNSRPLLDKRNLMKGQIKQVRADRKEYVLDSRLMNRVAYNRFPLADEVQEYRALLQGQQEIWDWRILFHYLNGSWGTFYVPTFMNDLPGVSTGAAATNFTCPDVDLQRLFGSPPVEPRKYLRFEYPDGTIIYAGIVNVTDGATLTVDTPLVEGSPRISFVSLARIVGDTATFNYERSNDEAEFAFTYRTVNT